MKGKEERYPDYALFKGLQRPLELMGIQGRYIYWAAGAAGGAIVGFILAYCLAGFVAGLVTLAAVLSTVSHSSSSNSRKDCTARRWTEACTSMPARVGYDRKKPPRQCVWLY